MSNAAQGPQDLALAMDALLRDPEACKQQIVQTLREQGTPEEHLREIEANIPAEFCQQKLREAWDSTLDGLLLALREGFLGVMTEPAGAAEGEGG
jgi:hypothetical protein